MKNRYLKDLRTNEEFDDFFIIKQVAIKTGSNRKHYLDLTLGDKSGEISAKKWDISDEEVQSLDRYIFYRDEAGYLCFHIVLLFIRAYF